MQTYGTVVLNQHRADIVFVDPATSACDAYKCLDTILVDYKYVKRNEEACKASKSQLEYTFFIVQRYANLAQHGMAC